MTAPASDWAARVESAALELHPALLKEAIANSRSARKDPAFLMGLAREIALSRGPELTRAYDSVVMVQPGFKKRLRDGREQLTRTPCVVFVVRAKWSAQAASATNGQHLPAWLVVFADSGGRRLPFALPTDVQEQSGFNRDAAQGAASVWLQPPGLSAETGAVACAVVLQGSGDDTPRLLSAQHVFTPCADVAAMGLQDGVQARPLGTGGTKLQQPVLATTLAFGGLLRDDEDPHRASLDVQLARVDNLAAARAVVGVKKLDAAEPWVKSAQRLWELAAVRWFYLVVPGDNGTDANRKAMEMQLDAPLALPHSLSYRVRRGSTVQRVDIYHDELLKFKVRAAPFPLAGDSGSAVVVRRPGQAVTFVGLYIGGNEDAAYAIPAWRLFDLGLWWDFPPGSTAVQPVSL